MHVVGSRHDSKGTRMLDEKDSLVTTDGLEHRLLMRQVSRLAECLAVYA